MRFTCSCLLSLICLTPVSAQSDTVRVLKEITVSGIRQTDVRQSTLNIDPIQYREMEQKGAFNLSDAIAKIPGVSQMTTGFAISKPVIRGLYGNRILTLQSGLRFDNQQWQDEHGLGLSQIGIQRVEVIRGPASILYGTDALGGVINIIEERVESDNPGEWDLNTRFFSNTIGTLTDVGFKRSDGVKWFRMRAGVENHADYSDGNGDRVLNSRSNGYYWKMGWGNTRNNWKSENTYNTSYTNLGFIVEDLNDIFDGDQRWSRSMEGPHHTVVLNVINSKHSKTLNDQSELQVNGGLQSNLRLENEGGGQISLNMHLVSLLGNVKWEKQLSEQTNLITNTQLTFENNTNYGARIIIPNANLLEINGSAFLRHTMYRWIFETGIGAGNKSIKTFETKMLNNPGKEIQPFSIHRPSFNGMAGFSFLPFESLTIKSNLSTGYRAPNLAELSSNGLHEGTIRYEIGDPDLDIEHNINGDITLEYEDNNLFIYTSTYYNEIYDYIYLTPSGKEFFGYPIYNFIQENATIYGGEAIINIHPQAWKGLQLKNSFSQIWGQLSGGRYLPFIAPAKLTHSLRLQLKGGGAVSNYYFEPEFQYVFSQSNPGDFETVTPAYQLFNFYAGAEVTIRNSNYTLYLSASNIFNEAFADHLSRLKYYGLNNPGRNITLNLHIPLNN